MLFVSQDLLHFPMSFFSSSCSNHLTVSLSYIMFASSSRHCGVWRLLLIQLYDFTLRFSLSSASQAPSRDTFNLTLRVTQIIMAVFKQSVRRHECGYVLIGTQLGTILVVRINANLSFFEICHLHRPLIEPLCA